MTAGGLSGSDTRLVEATIAAIKARFRPDRHVVGAAIRLRSGEVVTGVHLEANGGPIAVYAEAVALGRAATEIGRSDIAAAVAVYHARDDEVFAVAPCGVCREMISDYAPEATVLAPTDGGVAPRPIGERLPGKHRRD